mmetsp:Transcript_28706/g.65117  ORF Transcript_28706/g.65117 Transcript_28706/m.65117 type:complete len:203 (-) Transcript_28706:251-859(-)
MSHLSTRPRYALYAFAVLLVRPDLRTQHLLRHTLRIDTHVPSTPAGGGPRDQHVGLPLSPTRLGLAGPELVAPGPASSVGVGDNVLDDCGGDGGCGGNSAGRSLGASENPNLVIGVHSRHDISSLNRQKLGQLTTPLHRSKRHDRRDLKSQAVSNRLHLHAGGADKSALADVESVCFAGVEIAAHHRDHVRAPGDSAARRQV